MKQPFLILTILSVILLSCSRFTMTEYEIENIKLIETHCHIDWEGEDKMVELVALQREENLSFVLQISKNFEALIELVKHNKDFCTAVPWVVPSNKNYLEELDSVYQNNKELIKAIKIHPSIDGFEISVDLLKPLFEYANKHNLVIVTHTDNKAKSSYFISLMELYPQTKLVLYHASPWQEALDLISSYPNVYMDMSYLAWDKEFQQKAVKTVGKERILFGIDSPLGFKTKDGELQPHYREAAIEVADFYNNDKDIIEHIFYKNAEKLFGID